MASAKKEDTLEGEAADEDSDGESKAEAKPLFVLADDDSDEERLDEEAREAPRPSCLQAIVLSKFFTTLFSTLIVVNVIAMAIQADYQDDRFPPGCRGEDCYNLWPYVNLTFLGLFVVEIGMRLLAFGWCGFFVTAPDRLWNLFDFVIILLGVLDVLSRALKLGKQHGAAIALSRVLRILRVLRIVRLLRTFRQLRMLARGLVESVTVVFWIFFLIMFLIFIYAIFFTDMIKHRSHLWGDKEPEIKEYFGSIFLSSFTLFSFVTLDNWTDVDSLLMEQMPWPIQLVVFSFIIIESFVILSLLTGVMADHMDQVRKDEEGDLLKQNRNRSEKTEQVFKRLFTKGRRRGDGIAYATKKEFGTIFADRTIAQQLNADDIELTGLEALELFDVFDKDCDGVLMWQEFQNGMDDYREGLTIKQLLELKSIFNRLEHAVCRSHSREVPGGDYRKSKPSQAAELELAKTEGRIVELDKRLTRFDTRVKEMMALYGAKSGYSRRPSVKRRATSEAGAMSTRSSPT